MENAALLLWIDLRVYHYRLMGASRWAKRHTSAWAQRLFLGAPLASKPQHPISSLKHLQHQASDGNNCVTKQGCGGDESRCSWKQSFTCAPVNKQNRAPWDIRKTSKQTMTRNQNHKSTKWSIWEAKDHQEWEKDKRGKGSWSKHVIYIYDNT